MPIRNFALRCQKSEKMLISTEIGVNLGTCTTVYRTGWLLRFSRKMSVCLPQKNGCLLTCAAPLLYYTDGVCSITIYFLVQVGSEWNWMEFLADHRTQEGWLMQLGSRRCAEAPTTLCGAKRKIDGQKNPFSGAAAAVSGLRREATVTRSVLKARRPKPKDQSPKSEDRSSKTKDWSPKTEIPY